LLRLNAPNSLSTGAPPQTQLGELTALPRHLAVFKGRASNGREGREWEEIGSGGRDLAHPIILEWRPLWVSRLEH